MTIVDNTLETDLNRLAPQIQTVWTVKSAIGAVIAVLAVVVYDLTGLLVGGRALPPGLLSAVALLMSAVPVFGLPRLRYRFWRYRLRGEELFLERGIFNRVRTIVPLRRIQHLDVSQDLIEREFGLGKLIVHTAGTRSSDVVLPGLHIEEANRLRDELKNYILEDAV